MRLNEKVAQIDEKISCEKSYLVTRLTKERFSRRDVAVSDRNR